MGKKKEVTYYNGRYKGNKLTEEDCDKLEGIIKLSSKNGCIEDLRNIIYDLNPSDVNLIVETGSTEFVEMRKGTLTDEQTLGVAYLYYAKRAILGDSVGLGKTVQICGLCNLLESQATKNGLDFRFLILTEKTLVNKTKNKAIKFTGNYVESLFGEKDNILKFSKRHKGVLPPNVVGTHSLLNSVYFQDYVRGFIEEYGYNPFDILIIDESGDVLTNSATKTYQSALYFEGIFEYIIMLNATSFEGKLEHYYNQLNYIDNTLLPTKTEFEKKHKIYTYGVMPYPVFSGKYKNGEEFKNLVGYRYFQRTRKSLGAKMVDCSVEVYVSDLSPMQKSLLSKVSIPNMVYDCPSYFSNLIPGLETNPETTPKLQDLLEIIGTIPQEEPILIFTRYKEAQRCIYDLLCDLDMSCDMMNGDTVQKVRDDISTRFELGDLKVLITNVQKGLDFNNCNHCIFYDYDPNPDRMVQFEGRMTRERDIIGKNVYLILSRGAELRTFKNAIADKAQASDIFAGSDYSCVLSLLLDENRLKELK